MLNAILRGPLRAQSGTVEEMWCREDQSVEEACGCDGDHIESMGGRVGKDAETWEQWCRKEKGSCWFRAELWIERGGERVPFGCQRP